MRKRGMFSAKVSSEFEEKIFCQKGRKSSSLFLKKNISIKSKRKRDSNYFFNDIFNEHDAIMLLIDPTTGSIVNANKAACCFYGYKKDELCLMNIENINTLSRQEVYKQRMLAFAHKQKFFVFPHKLKSGEIKLVDVFSCPVTYNNHQLLLSIIFDVTDREAYRADLYKEKEFLRTTLLSIGDGVLITDKEGRIQAINPVAEEISGWQLTEVKGKLFSNVFKLVSETTGKALDDPVSKVLSLGKIICLANHTALITKNGRSVSIADSAAPIKDNQGNVLGVVIVFRDVTTEKIQNNKITYMSYHDALTGLYNRRFVEEQLQVLDEKWNFPLAVVMGDVNGLKLANDAFGHEIGDTILKKLSQIIVQCCRKNDIVARWGGDEFIILLPCSNDIVAQQFIQRVNEQCLNWSNGIVPLSIALGYAIKNKKEEDFWKVLKEAEEGLYRKKLMEGKGYRNNIIQTLKATLAEKSAETEEHAERLQHYCEAIGQNLKLSPKERDNLALLAVLHDIGKVAVNEKILKKPAALTKEEWAEMKKHSEIGYRIAQSNPEFSVIAECILSHHERWDGQGYPRKIKQYDIPLLARILAVADAYDAMTEDRVYRNAISPEKAIEEIKRNAGTQFDPNVVDAFLRVNNTKHLTML